MDTIDFIMAYEGGECSDEEVIEGFQNLIDSGTIWSLQGSYQRMANDLVQAGYCFHNSKELKVKAIEEL